MSEANPKYYRSGKKDGWCTDFYHKGRRYQIRFQAGKYEHPRQAAIDFENGIKGSSIHTGESSRSLRAQIDEYFRWSEITGKKKPETIKKQRCRLMIFCRWIDENATISSAADLTLSHLRQFQLYYNDPETNHSHNNQPRKNKGATWNKYRVNLSAFFNWSVDRGYMDHNLVAGREEFRAAITERSEPRYFTIDELRALFEWFDENLPDPHPAFYRLLAFTGIRPGELINLEWADVDLRRHRLTIRGRTSTKRKQPPRPYLNKRALEVIRSLPRRTHYLFDDSKGQPIWKRDRWSRWLVRALKGCDIKNANLKTFRHTFASHLVMAGQSLKAVSELLGHTSITTTEIYSHLAPDYLEDVVSKLPY